ncbi:MAG: TonB C-terminal domain-containing protein, partial [Myxococcaceae bacterium]
MPTPQRPQHRSTFGPALLLSLALHAGLVVLLVVLLRHTERPARPPRPATRISLRPLPRPPRPASPAQAPQAPSASRSHPPASASAPAQAEPAPVGAGAPSSPGGPPRPPPGDAPIELFPGRAVARGAGPVPPGDSGATTGHDVPESAEAEGRRVQQRVDTWRREGMAAYRVAVGVDDYFKEYRGALQGAMGPPPPGGGPKHGDLNAGQRWINSWLDALAAADPSRDPPSGERMRAQNVQDLSGRMDEFLLNQLGPMAIQPSFTAQQIIRHAVASVPMAVLRIVQRADGSIESTELVASSGDKIFDAYVQEHAKLALASVPRPPARQGAGLHPDGTRTEWAFFRAGAGCGV